MYAQGLGNYAGSRWSDRRATVRADALHPDRRAVRRPTRRLTVAQPASSTPAGADLIGVLRERPWIAPVSAVAFALVAGVILAIGASNAVLKDIAKPVLVDSDTAAGIAQALVDEQNLTDTARAPKLASPAFLAAAETSDTLPADLGRQTVATTADLRAEAVKTAHTERYYDEVQPVDRGVQIQANNGGSIVIHWSDDTRAKNSDRNAESVRQAETRTARGDELF